MNSPETPDRIDKLLREQEAHVPDNGFTQRVISALPRRRAMFPRVILLAVAISGAVIAAYWMPWRSLPPIDYTQSFAQNSKVLSAWLPFVAVGGVLIATLLAALRRRE